MRNWFGVVVLGLSFALWGCDAGTSGSDGAPADFSLTPDLSARPDLPDLARDLSSAGADLSGADLSVVKDGASSVDLAPDSAVASFNVSGAASAGHLQISVTFDAPPDATQAALLANYEAPGLTLSGVPVLVGDTVVIATSAQSVTNYAVYVHGVSRASDGAALTVNAASFVGRAAFNVASAVDVDHTHVAVTFDAPPNAAQAATLANYGLSGGLTVTAASAPAGNAVTLTTSEQSGGSYTVTVSNVTRANDGEALANRTAGFNGITGFNVVSAAATDNTHVNVTFDAPPDFAQATAPGNYTIANLAVSGATLDGSTVTLTSSSQAAGSYSVNVLGVTRAADGEALSNNSAGFSGVASFNVVSALSADNTHVTVTFDAEPNAVLAAVPGNYTISGLMVLSATPGSSSVSLVTSPQTLSSFTVTVENVTRDGDGQALDIDSAGFTGRGVFNVASAVSIDNTHFSVTFDAPPDPTSAATLANYTVSGLNLSGTPSLSGSTVTLVSDPQLAMSYQVTVAGVTRASDASPLSVTAAGFSGRTAFNVSSAAPVDNTHLNVTFDAPPNSAQATDPGNYQLDGGLTVTGVQGLNGSQVTLTTSSQSAGHFNLTVSTVTRASDGEPLANPTAGFDGRTTFNVTGAASIDNTQITVTFDAPPDPTQAATLGNYAVDGLILSGTPSLLNNTVTITSEPQLAMSYLVVVGNVTRAADGESLATSSSGFSGRSSFDVLTAVALGSNQIIVNFDAAPDATEAATLANYAVTGLMLTSVSGPVGNRVTLTTSAQAATSYSIEVENVTRASDGEPLTTSSANFTSLGTFNVVSAVSNNPFSVSVSFDAAPDPVQAVLVGNYAIPPLTLSAPVLNGDTVTLTTSQQSTSYHVTVSNLTRAADDEPLTVNGADFGGTAVAAPTVESVTVLSTVPDNGTVPYNTGTVTVAVSGTQFTTVTCPAGVKLDDLDGAGNAASTVAMACTVNSDSSITATFPAGVRTNAGTGWNVRVTNSAGSNSTSGTKLIPRAGLLISEVFISSVSPPPSPTPADREFVEIYNPTALPIEAKTLGLALHIRNSTGSSDANKPLTYVTGHETLPSHGFLLLTSSVATVEPWFADRDATYTAALVADGAVYIALSTTAETRVIDKVGWGMQSGIGVETAAAMSIPVSQSIARLPAMGMGHAQDNDDNSVDFTGPSATITPRGTSDPPQP